MAIQEAYRLIKQGGVVAHPTETCYGLACDLTNLEAVKKLFHMKKRPEDQPVSALFSSLDKAKKYVEWNEVVEDLARKYLPGPLTLVLPMRWDAPHRLFLMPSKKKEVRSKNQEATVGVRVSSDGVTQKIATLAGVPLSTTSANIHGKPEPYSVKEIFAQFEDQEPQPDLILDAGKLPPTVPSTVAAIQGNKVKILRQGSIFL